MAEEDRDAAKVSTVCAAVFGLIFTIGGYAVGGGRTALSIAVGATIAVANLLFLRAIIRAVIQPPPEEPGKPEGTEDAPKPDAEATPEPSPEPSHAAEGRRGGAAWGAFAVLKILLLFGGIYVLLTKNLVDPIPLVIGYGVLPLGITASTLVGSLRPRRRR